MSMDDIYYWIFVDMLYAFGLTIFTLPLVLIFKPKQIEKQYFDVNRVGVGATLYLATPSGWAAKAALIAGCMSMHSRQKKKGLEGIHLLAPTWYRALCWIFFWPGLINMTVGLVLTLLYLLISTLF